MINRFRGSPGWKQAIALCGGACIIVAILATGTFASVGNQRSSPDTVFGETLATEEAALGTLAIVHAEGSEDSGPCVSVWLEDDELLSGCFSPDNPTGTIATEGAVACDGDDPGGEDDEATHVGDSYGLTDMRQRDPSQLPDGCAIVGPVEYIEIALGGVEELSARTDGEHGERIFMQTDSGVPVAVGVKENLTYGSQ